MTPLSPLKGHVAKSQAENWDDDFEFSLSSSNDDNNSNSTLSENEYKKVQDENRDNTSSVCPKSMSLSQTKLGHADIRICFKVPAPLHIPCPQSPRHSSSYPRDLTPLSSKSKSSSSNPHPISPPFLSTQSNLFLPQKRGPGFRSRARSMTTISGDAASKKLTKRPPSASFITVPSSHSSRSLREYDSATSLSCSLHRYVTCPKLIFTNPEQSQSYSPGFHLPSPSLGSPYRRTHESFYDLEHPVPESSSLHIMTHGQNPASNAYVCSKMRSESALEADKINNKVPRRRVKDPHSSLSTSSEKMAEELGNDNEALLMAHARSSTTEDCPVVGSPNNLKGITAYPTLVGLGGKTSGNGHAGTGSSGAGFVSTIRRLGSISKKHGRRISGGWKFGQQSPSASASLNMQEVTPTGVAFDQSSAEEVVPLGTVIGSPVREDVIKSAEDKFVKPAMGLECNKGGVRRQTHWPPPSEDWDQDFSHNQSESQRIGSSVKVDPLIRTESRRREDKNRRRQSWNNFVIPKNVLEKQKEIKEGIGAIKVFARGVESLKSLIAAHSSLSYQLHCHESSPNSLRFDALHAEFAQWWEMAIVLVEVGSTGRDDSSHKPIEGPTREKGIALATEEAKIAGDTLRHVSGSSTSTDMSLVPSQGELTPSGHHSVSLSDTAEYLPSLRSPPRASPPPGNWRASTGRQSLSQRQLEVLRTMLRTPVSSSSKGARLVGQQESGQRAGCKTANATKIQDECSGSIVGTFTTPKNQNHFPNGAALVQNRYVEPIKATTKSKRRHTDKAGLAGLKEFLRSLRMEKSTGKANGQNHPLTAINSQAQVGEGIPAVNGTNMMMSRSNMDSSTAAENPPLLEPPLLFQSVSSTGNSCDVSHNSVFASNLQTELSPAKQPLMPDKSPPQPFSLVRQVPLTASPSVLPKSTQNPRIETKRPSIRNIFRTSSGSWGELINPNSGSPVQVSTKNSSPTLRKRGSMRRTLGQVSGVKDKPKRGEKVDNDRAEAKFAVMGSFKDRDELSTDGRGLNLLCDPLPGAHIQSTSSNEISTKATQLRAEEEMTLKPSKKTRAIGLGWPERKAEGDIKDFISPVFSGVSSTTHVSTTPMTHPSGLIVKELGRQDDSEGNVAIALTPDNLPTLLEYMRQCEAKLHEWKKKVQIEGLDKGFIMNSVKA
ncbi:hypothetical protein I305_06463 [Cryptococcus gattii E566]|uniref:Uncharacterized protein n=1 Tax=Cryptococcus gattii serotype B (strain WM276 / ATCC MYA-4071) TaxID=367775 RepID=E6R3D3_CRYGW|nr:uncharacterized protein CGB_C4180C [Cryptococcus gattii WM276]ADV21047.1 hypothetical protein CNC02740 [Cryptococcus gattii WM276]KIY31174.1 hypothetical protein I305_06463 [Cryptococcus gattii E566]